MKNNEKFDLREAFVNKQKFGKELGVSQHTVRKMIAKGQVETEMQGDVQKINIYRYRKQAGLV